MRLLLHAKTTKLTVSNCGIGPWILWLRSGVRVIKEFILAFVLGLGLRWEEFLIEFQSCIQLMHTRIAVSCDDYYRVDRTILLFLFRFTKSFFVGLNRCVLHRLIRARRTSHLEDGKRVALSRLVVRPPSLKAPR